MLIVGLGNPGADYAETRHNAGFWFVDALADRLRTQFRPEAKLHAEAAKVGGLGRALWLLRPTTYMNRSGSAVAAALRYYKLDPAALLVAHDELDLPPGVARLKFGGGHGGQNGLKDIMAQLGTGEFHRLRLGIGHPGHKDQVTPWVLGRPSQEHRRAIVAAVEAALAVMPLVLEGNWQDAMQRLHSRPAA